MATASSLFKALNKRGVTSSEWMVWRNGWNLVVTLYFLVPKKINPRTQGKGNEFNIFMRVLTGQLGFLLLFYSATLIPISLLMILVQTSPLWTSILGYFLNNERILKVEYVAMAISFLGVLAIALSKQGSQSGGQSQILGICTAVTMAWVYSLNCVFSRRLSEVYFAVVTFWHFLTGTTLGLIYLLVYYLVTGTPSFEFHDT